jgi:phosphoribosylaminoimidazole-succinocarboxamide synthase
VRVPIGEGFFLYAPTTKHEEHDRPLSPDEIISGEWLSRADWEAASTHALELFAFGQQVAREHGLILVDTKYEFGKDAAGNILLIDEIHTPDSSRYWLAEGYEERFASGEEPDNIDKEFLRLWFAEHCDPYNDPTLPPAPDALRIELSRRYILLYELITGEAFQFPEAGQPVQERIRDSLAAYQ